MISAVTGWANVTEHLNENILSDALSTILTKHPNVQFAFYTRTADTVQLFFLKLMGGMIPDGMSDTDALSLWNRHNLVSAFRFSQWDYGKRASGSTCRGKNIDIFRHRNRILKRNEHGDLHILKGAVCTFVCVCRQIWRLCSRNTPTFAPSWRQMMVTVPPPLIAHWKRRVSKYGSKRFCYEAQTMLQAHQPTGQHPLLWTLVLSARSLAYKAAMQ